MENTRVFIEKKEAFDVEAKNYLNDFRSYLNIFNLEKVRVINVYDIKSSNEIEILEIIEKVLYEPYTDLRHKELTLKKNEKAFRIESHKGQFNQREDSTNEIIKKFLNLTNIEVKHSKIIVLSNINDEELERIKSYYINPIEYKEVELNKITDDLKDETAKEVEIINGFINTNNNLDI